MRPKALGSIGCTIAKCNSESAFHRLRAQPHYSGRGIHHIHRCLLRLIKTTCEILSHDRPIAADAARIRIHEWSTLIAVHDGGPLRKISILLSFSAYHWILASHIEEPGRDLISISQSTRPNQT